MGLVALTQTAGLACPMLAVAWFPGVHGVLGTAMYLQTSQQVIALQCMVL